MSKFSFVVSILSMSSNVSWSNMPAAIAEFINNTGNRAVVNLYSARRVRLIINVMVAGFSTAELRVQYSEDQSNWFYLDGIDGPKMSINVASIKISPWVDIAQQAKKEVFLRVVGINGNGIVDPAFRNVLVEFD